MKTIHQHIQKSLAGAVLLGFSAAVIAGPPVVVEATPPSNPLSFADGMFTFDVEERARWEIRENNFDFNSGVRSLTDDNWVLQRFRLGLAIKPTPWLKIYGQVQDSREWLSDRADFPGALGAEGDDTFDLRLGYVEIADYSRCPWGIMIGRQVLSYGDERLIGAFDWNNIGRTFDAVKLTYKGEKFSVDAFAATVVVPTRGEYNQSDFLNGTETEREQIFSGIYASTTVLPFQITDLYVLHLHQEQATTSTSFFTIGTRFKSTPGYFAAQESAGYDKDGKTMLPPPARKAVGFDYAGEFAVQFGEVADGDLLAFAAHIGAGYTFDAAIKPRIGLSYSYGSGDGDPTDGDIETFQNLFPTNHKFYGMMDTFSWQNMHNIELSLQCAPTKKLTAKAAFHAFWLATTDDSWYRANGVATVRPLNAVARSAGNFAGTEVDVTLGYAVTKNVKVEAGYSHFFAGDYLSATGASDDADFGYVMATVAF